MSNVTAKEAGTIHGQNPQYLVIVEILKCHPID